MIRLHPKWGYDLDRVSQVRCLHCEQPIGDRPYCEVTTLARFGQMLFIHKECMGKKTYAKNHQWKGEEKS